MVLEVEAKINVRMTTHKSLMTGYEVYDRSSRAVIEKFSKHENETDHKQAFERAVALANKLNKEAKASKTTA